MKKTLVAITLSIAMLGCMHLQAQKTIQISGEQNGISVKNNTFFEFSGELSTSELTLIETNTPKGLFTRLAISGNCKTDAYGQPEMPAIRKLIRVPLGAEALISISELKYTDIDLKEKGYPHPVYPAQPPRSKSEDIHEFVYDQSVYKQAGFIEHELLSVQMLGIMRDKRIARINFVPFRYDPVSHTLRVYHHIEFNVEFKNADIPATLSLEERYASICFQTVNNSLYNEALAANKENFKTYPVKYVIIADRMFESQLQPFIEWKTLKGFHVVEAYTDEGPVGGSLVSIKSYIQGLYNAGTPEDPAPSYILFVGDIQQIPTWDNGNGATDRNYCEFTNDLFPEIYYGRFSAQNPSQLQPYIDKTLQYEKYTMPDPTYLDEVVMVAGMDGSFGASHGNGQINYGTNNYFNPEHDILSHTYLYPNSGSNAAQIRQDISDGVTFGNYTAHCSPDGWSDPNFSISHIPALQNQDMYCVLIGNCCSSSEYQLNECFGEAIVRAENKGAVGYIGASNSTYWDEDYYFGVGVGQISQNPPSYDETSLGNYDRSFHDHGEEFGEWYVSGDEIIFAGNMAVTEGAAGSAEYYWDIYNYMGDPSLMVYYSNPPVIAVSYAPLLPLQSTSFTVTTEAYAYVAMSLEGDLIASALANENGIAVLEFPPLSISGDGDIVVTKQNGQPYFGNVLITSPSGPYLILDQVAIGDPNGNQNGQADCGETIAMNVSLENAGNGEALNTISTLSGDDPYVTVTKDNHTWPDIPGLSTVTEDGTFEMEIASFVPDQYTVSFEIELETSSKGNWMYDYELVINAPVLTIGSMVIDDSQSGNDNGRLDPGETATIKVINRNTGHCPAENTETAIVSTSQYLNLSNYTFSIGTLGVLGYTYSEFEVEVDADAPDGAAFAEFDYTITSGEYTSTKQFRQRIGLIMEDFETGDFTKFDWVMGGDQDWQTSGVFPYEGDYSAKSGLITDGQSSELKIVVDVMIADTVYFFHKTASQLDDDLLKFYIGNTMVGQWSGIGAGWNEIKAYIPTGIHTLKWVYEKDANGFAGNDCAWLDNIIFPPLMTLTCYAGPDAYACDGSDFECLGQATDWVDVTWTSNGDGTFDNPNILQPVYTPGSDDIASGNVLLTLMAEDAAGSTVDDAMYLSVFDTPETPATPTGPDHVTVPPVVSSVYNTDAVPYAEYYEWAVNPIEAGSFSGMGPAGTILWNTSFVGTASISVRAMNNCGDGLFSDGIDVIVDHSVGITEAGAGNNLEVYPNPNTGNFNILVTENVQNSTINVYNVIGEKVFTLNTNMVAGEVVNIELSNNPKGLYILSVEAVDFSFTEKLVIK